MRFIASVKFLQLPIRLKAKKLSPFEPSPFEPSPFEPSSIELSSFELEFFLKLRQKFKAQLFRKRKKARKSFFSPFERFLQKGKKKSPS